ncbi:YT521-B-like domain-containing protein, partial [Mycena galopus ATCC 62051]
FRAMWLSPVGEAAIAPAAVEAGRSHERRESLAGSGSAAPLLESVAAEAVVEGDHVGAPIEEGWGEDFQLQWLCTDRLPFVRSRRIHNPWNHDREVKVSRDGTEIEPMVGQALLEAWRLHLASEAGTQTRMPSGGGSASVRSSRAGGRGRAGSRL